MQKVSLESVAPQARNFVRLLAAELGFDLAPSADVGDNGETVFRLLNVSVGSTARAALTINTGFSSPRSLLLWLPSAHRSSPRHSVDYATNPGAGLVLAAGSGYARPESRQLIGLLEQRLDEGYPREFEIYSEESSPLGTLRRDAPRHIGEGSGNLPGREDWFRKRR